MQRLRGRSALCICHLVRHVTPCWRWTTPLYLGQCRITPLYADQFTGTVAAPYFAHREVPSRAEYCNVLSVCCTAQALYGAVSVPWTVPNLGNCRYHEMGWCCHSRAAREQTALEGFSVVPVLSRIVVLCTDTDVRTSVPFVVS